MIPVGRLAPVGQWDQSLLDDLFANRLYPTGLNFQRHEGYPVREDGAVILCPGRYWVGHEAEISMAISKYRWVLLMVTSDEESLFDVRKVVHPNLRVWQQTPRQGRDYGAARLFGVGYTPHARQLPVEPPEKTLDVFLSAQRTTTRREEAFKALEHVPHSRVEPTPGFTQGMDPLEYVSCMSKAKVAPAPSGAVSPDSFRLWEALEAHCVPLPDAVSPVDGPTEYWDHIGYPFPVVGDWTPELVDVGLADCPANANRVAAWWMRYKRQLALWLREDLKHLGGIMSNRDTI